MKQIYKTAFIGPFVTIKLVTISSKSRTLSLMGPAIELAIVELTKGWKVLLDEQHNRVCA